jgi:DNA-binding transcriptional LysR family regulator
MMTLVSAAMGCTVLPESASRIAPDNVKFLEISDLNLNQQWELVWRKDNRSTALRRFIEVASIYLKEPQFS